MLQQADLRAAIDAYEKTMQSAIEASRSLTLPTPTTIVFCTSELDELVIATLLDDVPTTSQSERSNKKRGFLYVFRTTEQCTVARPDIINAMEQARKLQNSKERNLAAVNVDAPAGRVLYVGRSWGPSLRVSGHLRAEPGGRTYAIHFAAWAKALDLEVELAIYEFPGIASRTLQVLEDGLWDQLRPLFGRRGEK